jgi:hypothetical protein
VRSSRCWWRARSLLPSATASSPPPHSQGRAAQGRVSKPHSETPSALSCLSDLPRDVCSLGLVATGTAERWEVGATCGLLLQPPSCNAAFVN